MVKLSKVTGEKHLYTDSNGLFYIRTVSDGKDTCKSLKTTRISVARKLRDDWIHSERNKQLGIVQPKPLNQVLITEILDTYQQAGFPDRKGNPRLFFVRSATRHGPAIRKSRQAALRPVTFNNTRVIRRHLFLINRTRRPVVNAWSAFPPTRLTVPTPPRCSNNGRASKVVKLSVCECHMRGGFTAFTANLAGFTSVLAGDQSFSSGFQVRPSLARVLWRVGRRWEEFGHLLVQLASWRLSYDTKTDVKHLVVRTVLEAAARGAPMRAVSP
jgi:hypothetical protein